MDITQLGAGSERNIFRRREEPSISELVQQGRCEHRWLIFAMAAGSTGFEFRRCPRCGKNAWVGPEGPVELHDVLRVLASGRLTEARRYCSA
jgi:hypothetical protein